ncbi:uncharacterized protein L203_104600 [Cryptococcus depauperatus CBS 7841]|uniref:Midasin n=1 Tax=Cryptococcus depauperatus CBS 7841 TaxID=1295531 RepID=A0AAJ8JVT3_9TREE
MKKEEDSVTISDTQTFGASEVVYNDTQSASPLQLDLRRQLDLLLEDIGLLSQSGPTSVPIPDIFFQYKASNVAAGSTRQLLEALSWLSAQEGLSQYVLSRFRPIILDILARWLENASNTDAKTLEKRLHVFASLAEVCPELWSLVNAFIQQSPFKTSLFAFIPKESLLSVSAERFHLLLMSYLRLAVVDPMISSRNNWSMTPLHHLRTEHPDLGVRLLSIQILARQQPWNEEKRRKMERTHVGDVEHVNVEVLFGHDIVVHEKGGFEVKPLICDGWALAIFEARRVDMTHREVMNHSYLSTATITSEDLSSRTVVVVDQLMLRDNSPNPISTISHVRTKPTDATLRALCPLIQISAPILLTSPPSSGKTHILQYLASVLFLSRSASSRILTIPLADTTIDAKSLIGTYISSPTRPGAFEWVDGALTKAIKSGRWVVFEDVDRGNTEMLVTLAGIARSLRNLRPGRRAILSVPGREDIEASYGSAFFATRTIRQGYTPPTFHGHHLFSEVLLEPLADEDILSILCSRFTRLPSSVLVTLVNIWHRLRPFNQFSVQVKARDIGLRDLEKWCARVARNLPPSSSLVALEQTGSVFSNPVLQDETFLEGVDIFVASFDTKSASMDKKQQMMAIIAQGLGMDEDRVTALSGRKPRFEVNPATKQLHVGRVAMEISASERNRRTANSSRPFALTKPSLVLLERIAVSLVVNEPILLVGETGTGKTTAVQHISSIVRKPLTVLNLSMQTESSDLLGGFKPIDASLAAKTLHSRWQKLFCETFVMGKPTNGAYVEAAARALSTRKWTRCTELWSSSARRALDKLGRGESDPSPLEGSPAKRRKVSKATRVSAQWQSLLTDIVDFDLHHAKMKSRLVFSFVEGPLVKAMRILLDEVNLASQETLEAISAILESPTASLVLTERGDVEPTVRHPDFRLFACMNPATDVGKKDLPPNLRARFTEIYVPPPDDDREALISIVFQYLGDAATGDKSVVLDIAELYAALKNLVATKEIVDGSNTSPHYSMRTLARALTFAVESSPLFGIRRGLWEGYLMAFTMSLDATSAKTAHEIGEKYILAPMKNARAVLSQIPTLPSAMDPNDYVRFGPFWLEKGPLSLAPESRYIITPSVQAKLSDLARVILTKRYPVLIQGPTSAGKTSAVEFLARQTGHRFIRINNHEHTDIQEYLGTYVTDTDTGNLVFQEGLLVTAVKQGHWIVLDELNLAPTDVLEALNRLLDDNRELVVPETQEIIKPHPNFILFATQNPPGLYAGRKILSRAFRNRFLEVHFDDVPKDELETILCQRCQIAPSYAKKIVQVFEELRHRRQATRVFESKQSFATLRDLFRWAERGAVGYQQLAEDGYMLLAERARHADDKAVIKEVIEKTMKVSINENIYQIFDQSSGILARLPQATLPPTSMVWTKAMQRLFTLVAFALSHNEPVLLVGETGCGKTSVCEIIANMFAQQLVGVSCHQNMETADLLGSQRPVRNKSERRAKIIKLLSQYMELPSTASDADVLSACATLSQKGNVDPQLVAQCQKEAKQISALFEWRDGPLVQAMNAGDLLLLDEVSLADDSVLERLNSVLEPGRTLILAEKGGIDIDEVTIIANEKFHVVATMNPGGDFGKKELSPALRNRFTEIWVPALDDRNDILQIIKQSINHEELAPCGPLMLDYFLWFGTKIGDTIGLGLRDILAWINFTNSIYAKGVSVAQAFHHGGQMVFIDGLESLPQTAGMSITSISNLRQDCVSQLDLLTKNLSGDFLVSDDLDIRINAGEVSVGTFSIARGHVINETIDFQFRTPTTMLNTMRLVRGCQLPKPILLEGSPGVGKTSLVSALACVAGFRLQRINLSDQTDLIDLFGSDLPVEGGKTGEFKWRDAVFLDAMQKGDWVLLDEMNLASQTVLEGLNAVLDHRGTIFIPELGKSFHRHPNFRVFAAQNPLQQGGGRKGLPKSFLNRFTKVYLQEHTPKDLMIICRDLLPMPVDYTEKMIAFNETIRIQTMVTRVIGREGSPWEFNLRDLLRWFTLLSAKNGLEQTDHPVEFFKMVYLQRFRTETDRQAVINIFENMFAISVDLTRPTPFITPSWMQIGHSLIRRGSHSSFENQLQHSHLEVGQSILKGIEMGWLIILAGSNGTGKRSIIRDLAKGAGRQLGEFAVHPGVDTSEILGSFEQQNVNRLLDAVSYKISDIISSVSDEHPLLWYLLDELSATQQQSRNASPIEFFNEFVRVSEYVIAQLSAFVDVAPARQSLDYLIEVGPSAVGFTWVDGQLIHAIRSGEWFLISEANLCSASVLDRLNSLFETNGILVLTEKGSSTGSPEILRPHQDFRLFMTYDPQYGELSRAMRNRGVELFIDDCSRNVSNRPIPLVLAADSLLRQAALLQSKEEVKRTPSVIANQVSLQSQDALSLISHLGTEEVNHNYGFISKTLSDSNLRGLIQLQSANIGDSQGLASDLLKILPIDPTLNPNIRSTARQYSVVFKVIQTLLRNDFLRSEIQAWVSDPANVGSVLATSALSMRQRPASLKTQTGKDVYPFINAFQEVLQQKLALAASHSPEFLQHLDLIFVYVLLIKEHAKYSVFDYSSTKLLASWLENEITSLQLFSPLTSQLHNLAKTVQITAGLGQSQLWNMFREAQPTLDIQNQNDTQELVNVADKILDPQLRCLVLQALSHLSNFDSIEATHEVNELLASAPSTTLSKNVSERWLNWDIFGSLELAALYKIDPSDVFNVLLEEKNVSISSLLPLQRALSRPHSCAMFPALASWIQRLWNHTDVHEHTMCGGPANLFKPIRLSSALRFGVIENVKIADIPEQDDALNFSIQTVLFDVNQRHNYREGAMHLAIVSIALVLSACGMSIMVIDNTFEGNISETIADMFKAVAQLAADSQFQFLVDAFDRRLRAALTLASTSPDSLEALGQIWLAASFFLIDLYVTNIPIDPGVHRGLREEVLSQLLSFLRQEVDVVVDTEIITKGTSESARVAMIQQRISSLEQEREGLGPALERSTNAVKLSYLFGEVQGFLTDLYNEDRILNIIEAFRAGHPQAQSRESDFQLSSAAFIQRLATNYEDIADLVQPVTIAILFGKLGMRIIARNIQLQETSPGPIIPFVVSFPMAQAVRQLQHLATNTAVDDASGVPIGVLIAAAHLYEMDTKEQRSYHVPRFSQRLDYLYQTWSVIQLREQQETQDAESLYRTKKTDVEVLSDDEQEAKEFAELFPQYDDAGAEDEILTEKDNVAINKQKGFSSTQVTLFASLIKRAFGDRCYTPTSILKQSIDEFLHRNFDPTLFDETLDTTSLEFQIAILHGRRAELQTSSTPFNFYLSSNEPEIRKAHVLLVGLVKRLIILEEEWPEQMVLVHIRERCERILALDIRNPVAKILSALEQLLLHTEDWEAYANRENSLAVSRDKISTLIIEWRKLELASWTRLLEDQAEQYTAGDDQWALRLYGGLVHSVAATDNISKHLEDVLPLITTFINTSTLGCFSSRLEFIACFQHMTAEMAISTPVFSDVATLLHNVLAKARLFEPRIRDSLSSQRSTIDQSIKDFIKLASWKDVNVFALKASAQKSHKALHRSIRKFRDVLRQPISPLLNELNAIIPQEAAVLSEQLSLPAPGISKLSLKALNARKEAIVPISGVLVQLEVILDRYTRVHSELCGDANGSTATLVNSMTVEIIEAADSLAKQTPSILTKENEKIVNNLASRKRKAYIDLLKTLRASGFSQNVRADRLAQQQSTTWLARQLSLPIECLPVLLGLDDLKKIEVYHHKLEVLMPALRLSFNGHHLDIASQDLQRGIGFVESVYSLALNERSYAVRQIQSLSKLYAIYERIRLCADSTSVNSGYIFFETLKTIEASACQMFNGLGEVEQGIHRLRDLQGRPCQANDIDAIHKLRQETNQLIESLSLTLNSAKRSGCMLFTLEEYNLIETAKILQKQIVQTLQNKVQSCPELHHLLDPVSDMVRLITIHQPSIDLVIKSEAMWVQSDEILRSMLVVAQQLKPPSKSDLEDEEYPHLLKEFKNQRSVIGSLRILEVINYLSSFTSTLNSSTAIPDCLSRMLPFLDVFIHTYAHFATNHFQAVKATYKLAYVVGRVVLDLAQKGFCKPQEEGDDSGKGDDGEMVQGTGMGAGSGEKNISKEIKEESQVEGLQDEEDEQQQQGEDNEDAFSMDEDFEGTMGEGKDQEEGSGNEEEEEEDHDEHVGDVDPLDPGAVDEKFWGDERQKENQKDSDETMDQSAPQEQEGESEIAAKEDDKKKNKTETPQNDDKEAAEGEQSEQKQGEQGGDEEEGEEFDNEDLLEENGEGEEHAGLDQQQVSMPEGETLDLPAELNLDDDGMDEGQDDEKDVDDDMDMGMSVSDMEEDRNREGEELDMTNDEEGETIEEAPPATGLGEDEAEEAQMGQDADLSRANEQAQESEANKGVGGGLEGQVDKEKKDRTEQQKAKDDEVEAEAQGLDGSASQSQQQGPSSNEQEADGPVDSSGAPLPANNQSQTQSLRSLGDILKEIQRRRDEILSQQETDDNPSANDHQAPEETPGQVEYVKEDEAKENDQQALGSAGNEERQRLEDLKIVDDDETGDTKPAMEEDMDDESDDAEASTMDQRERDSTHQSRGVDENEKQTEKALTQADLGCNPAGDAGNDGMDIDSEEFEDVETTKEIADVEVEEAELNVLDPIPTSSQATNAEEIWRRYAAMTSDLSFALCEQLRLILEPTLATRLQGDFRTGKRLNMRKIIPYIASEYTKDKIWLRRTKPSRREYQVMLSLDDSRSMSESHSIDLAYQTLALVAQAMNKLEVGQISIAKFGESVDILHPFKEGGFTDSDGAKVMSSFKFDQQKTDVASLVERTLGYLSEARHGPAMHTSAPDLWQLQIIISDGVCQDHGRLRRLLRKAVEERVMVVFIIVDSLQTQPSSSTASSDTRPSILSMQTVEYKNVNGEMKLEMQRYLDTFPFEFYVVLRDVEALPGVLADTLRQWMTRVSQSQE